MTLSMDRETDREWEPTPAPVIKRDPGIFTFRGGVMLAPRLSRHRPIFVNGLGYMSVEDAREMIDALYGAVTRHEQIRSGVRSETS